MTGIKTETTAHPTEVELAGLLDRSASHEERKRLESHVACCSECLASLVSAHETVELFNKNKGSGKERINMLKKVNWYLVLAVISFAMSFIMPGHFIQFLVVTLLFGIKWIVDAKSTRMLVMIYEAWKTGGGQGASRILETMDSKPKNRFLHK